ncbi:craniofacial development protein 2-like [Nilaparvata lugens]|uniref:craniofacial development protein 2-like n=1 Tax=Nilaparvata lugens TaxID=108931 RepID=UPI00193D42AA|nr:craniofacial development protein 2-like [Nilaparvata lugens]
MKFGTWNVTSIAGKECEVVEEMEKYGLKLMGISETKKKGCGEMALDKGYTFLYSGVEMKARAKEGVGIILSDECQRKMVSWTAVNSRIISADLEFAERVSLIQIYAPTDDSAELEKETFYSALQETVDKARQYAKHIIIMGDWNARVGNDITIGHECLGKHGAESVMNGSGKRMLEFCVDNDLLVGNSFFPHKSIHKITFESPNRGVKSAIDYFVYSRHFRYAVTDVRVYRSAELSTEHKLLIMDTQIRPPKKYKSVKYEKIKIMELKKAENRREYQRLITEELLRKEEEIDGSSEENIEKRWCLLKKSLLRVAEEVCGKTVVGEHVKRTKWWNDLVKEKVRLKKEAWKKFLRTKNADDWTEYVQRRRESKQEVRKAKLESWEELEGKLRKTVKQ